MASEGHGRDRVLCGLQVLVYLFQGGEGGVGRHFDLGELLLRGIEILIGCIVLPLLVFFLMNCFTDGFLHAFACCLECG